MMSAPKKALAAKKPEEAKPGRCKHEGHTAQTSCRRRACKPAKPGRLVHRRPAAAAGAGKEVKSAKLSSSWAGDPAKKKDIQDPWRHRCGRRSRTNWRSGPRGKRGSNDRDRDDHHCRPRRLKRVCMEVHVPETITVAELAHKMAIKASEVIKHLMKLGQMVTINQPLDQDTAMIVVEEMGHKAVVAALDDPEAFTDDDVQVRKRNRCRVHRW